MDSYKFFFVAFHFPFPAVSRSTIFWYSSSFNSLLNFDPSFCTFRLNNSFIVYLLKSINFPMTYTFFPFSSTMLEKNSLTHAAHPGALCSPSNYHPLFSCILKKWEMSLLNPLSTMKTLSFKLFSIKAEALSENKILALSFLCSVSTSSAPIFLFLYSSSGCSGSTLASALSSSCISLDFFS